VRLVVAPTCPARTWNGLSIGRAEKGLGWGGVWAVLMAVDDVDVVDAVDWGLRGKRRWGGMGQVG